MWNPGPIFIVDIFNGIHGVGWIHATVVHLFAIFS